MRRIKRNRKKGLRHIPTIYISLILMLNAMGVSYAVWNDDINIKFKLSTGFIEPKFERVDKTIGDGVTNDIRIRSDGDNTLYISGACIPDFIGQTSVNIINEGSIPIVYKDFRLQYGDDFITPSYGFPLDSFIEKNDAKTLNLQVNAGNISEGVETNNYSYKLEFEQGPK